jgi:hypothetical protein
MNLCIVDDLLSAPGHRTGSRGRRATRAGGETCAADATVRAAGARMVSHRVVLRESNEVFWQQVTFSSRRNHHDAFVAVIADHMPLTTNNRGLFDVSRQASIRRC